MPEIVNLDKTPGASKGDNIRGKEQELARGAKERISKALGIVDDILAVGGKKDAVIQKAREAQELLARAHNDDLDLIKKLRSGQ